MILALAVGRSFHVTWRVEVGRRLPPVIEDSVDKSCEHLRRGLVLLRLGADGVVKDLVKLLNIVVCEVFDRNGSIETAVEASRGLCEPDKSYVLERRFRVPTTSSSVSTMAQSIGTSRSTPYRFRLVPLNSMVSDCVGKRRVRGMSGWIVERVEVDGVEEFERRALPERNCCSLV